MNRNFILSQKDEQIDSLISILRIYLTYAANDIQIYDVFI